MTLDGILMLKLCGSLFNCTQRWWYEIEADLRHLTLNNQNTTNMDLFTELGNLLNPAIAVEPVLVTGLTCRKCKHNQSWQCNSKVFHYCGIRKSNLTSNKLLKIKCKNPACSLFEPCC